MALLEIANLNVDFDSPHGRVRVIDDLNIRIEAGEIHGIIGESGSGKSVLALAIAGLLSSNAHLQAAQLRLAGQDLLSMTASARRKFLGQNISIIFQDPHTSLNPALTIGHQVNEALQLHERHYFRRKHARALALLEAVGLPDPARCFKSYPHQLSGGMIQRVMIAIAIACQPVLLIADEPTTTLDLPVQAQILKLLLQLNKEHNMALLLITHDFGTLFQNTQRITVMYSGQAVEAGPSSILLQSPRHPYTRALLDSIPHFGAGDIKRSRLTTLSGSIPPLHNRPVGCPLGPRCPYAAKTCVIPPRLSKDELGVAYRCYFPLSYPQSRTMP